MAFNGKKPRDLLDPSSVMDSAKQSIMKPTSVIKGDGQLKTEREASEFEASEAARRKGFRYSA